MGFLLISSVATLSWGKLRPRKHVRLEMIAFFGLVGAALLTEPWWTLVGIRVVYLALLPVGVTMYWRIKRQRAARPAQPEESGEPTGSASTLPSSLAVTVSITR